MANGWRDRAACKEHDLALFFGPAEDQGREKPRQRERRIEQAKEVCRSCSVVDDCLEYHLAIMAEQYGVAGGLDEDERRKFRKRRLRKQAKERKTAGE